MDYNKRKHIAKAKAIEDKNKKSLLNLNPKLNDNSGIYFLTREDEDGIKYSYVGQALHVLTRLAQHMVGYTQHIDLSIKKHKLYSEKNPFGWKVEFTSVEEDKLDEMERYYIIWYAKHGYQSRNKDTGGGKGKQEIGERKSPKGYRDGIKQGKKTMAREITHIIDKHLLVELRPDKKNNKVSQKAFEKFKSIIDERNYD